jgi:hypothetical protein
MNVGGMTYVLYLMIAQDQIIWLMNHWTPAVLGEATFRVKAVFKIVAGGIK